MKHPYSNKTATINHVISRENTNFQVDSHISIIKQRNDKPRFHVTPRENMKYVMVYSRDNMRLHAIFN